MKITKKQKRLPPNNKYNTHVLSADNKYSCFNLCDTNNDRQAIC